MAGVPHLHQHTPSPQLSPRIRRAPHVGYPPPPIQNKLLITWWPAKQSLSLKHPFGTKHAQRCRDDDRTKAAYDLEDKGWNGSQMGEATRTLMKYLNQPFQELRYAAFRVATSMALHPWGVRALFSSPGFHEFLLNRNTESSKTGLEHKYALVRAVLACDEAHPDAALLPTERRQQLRSYQAQGTFFVLPEYVTKIADQSAWLRESSFFKSINHDWLIMMRTFALLHLSLYIAMYRYVFYKTFNKKKMKHVYLFTGVPWMLCVSEKKNA